MVDGSIVDVEQRANAASWAAALQHHLDVRGSIPVLDGRHKAPSGSEVEGGPVDVICKPGRLCMWLRTRRAQGEFFLNPDPASSILLQHQLFRVGGTTQVYDNRFFSP